MRCSPAVQEKSSYGLLDKPGQGDLSMRLRQKVLKQTPDEKPSPERVGGPLCGSLLHALRRDEQSPVAVKDSRVTRFFKKYFSRPSDQKGRLPSQEMPHNLVDFPAQEVPKKSIIYRRSANQGVSSGAVNMRLRDFTPSSMSKRSSLKNSEFGMHLINRNDYQ